MKFFSIVLLLISTALPQLIVAEQLTISGGISSTSIVNGISQSRDKTIMLISGEWDFDYGFYTGAMLYAGETAPAPQLTQGYAAYFGFFKPLNDKRAIELSVSQYGYRGKFQSTWDYFEYQVTYHHSQTLSVTNSYTDDYYGRGYSSHTIKLNWQPKISKQSYAVISAGNTFLNSHYQPSEIFNSILGFGWQKKRWSFLLSYQYSDRKAEMIHGNNAAGNRLVLEIKYAIY